jgi:general secretion pathway protein G
MNHTHKDNRAEKNKPLHLNSETGLTFLEIMIVLIIVGVIMATFGSRLLGAGDKAKADLTRISMTQLKQDIEQFQLRYNSLPSSLEDLVKCNQLTGNACTPITKDASLMDAWGTKFQYRAGSGRSYSIKSLGADGRDGGDGVNADLTLEGP